MDQGGEKESLAQLGNVATPKVKLVLEVAQEVATLRSHFDSVTLVFASAGEDRRQEGDGTDTLNLNAWANGELPAVDLVGTV